MRGQVDFGAMVQNAKTESGAYTPPANQFQYKLGSNGTFECVFDFLPAPDLGGLAYATTIAHKLTDVNGKDTYYTCPKMDVSNDDDCPICQIIKPLWNEGREDEYRAWKQQKQWFANVRVRACPSNKEIVGKVFVLKFGYQILQKIEEMITPEEGAIQQPVNIFAYDSPKSLHFKVRKKGKYNNYEASTWVDRPEPFTDDELEIIDAELHDLSPLLDEKIKSTKSYDEIALAMYNATGEHPNDWNPSDHMSGKSKAQKPKNDAPKGLKPSKSKEEVDDNEVDAEKESKAKDKPKADKKATKSKTKTEETEKSDEPSKEDVKYESPDEGDDFWDDLDD